MKNKIIAFIGFFVFAISFLIWSPDIVFAIQGPVYPDAIAFADGVGSTEDPYQVTSCEQLLNFYYEPETYLSANYILENNIDCSATNE